MFQLFDPSSFKAKAPRWAHRTPQYTVMFGISSFADLFVCSEDHCSFAVVATERPELIDLKFKSNLEFTEQFLKNAGVLNSLLRRPDHDALCARLGPLGKDECFFAVPFQAVGGSGALGTYVKGNAWVHLDIYAQTLGF